MPRDVPDEGAVRLNISLPARVLRAADWRARSTQEPRSAYLARLIREDVGRTGMSLTDKRFDPPKEKK